MPKNLSISDPVYGFIFMPYGLLTDVVAHPFSSGCAVSVSWGFRGWYIPARSIRVSSTRWGLII